ncbi:hypothetical protein ACJ2A9_22720 [Anaerobacillus sp. MEB173]|uniref:hypothetical protein n=1 Tax=Anaerobacillus sp. MEB173 TaxID=3383345 RepID=UPI003F8E109E
MKQSVNKVMSNESGSSLVFAMLVSFLLITSAAIVVHFSNTELLSAKKQDYQTSAFYIAEAGLERAINEINKKLPLEQNPEDVHYNNVFFQDGTYNVIVQERKNAHNELVGWDIESTGKYEGETEVINAFVKQPIIQQPYSSDFNFALFGNEKVMVQTFSASVLFVVNITHKIQLTGDAHGNDRITFRHNVLDILGSTPRVNLNNYNGKISKVSSSNRSNIEVTRWNPINEPNRFPQYERILLPRFDFDHARKMAKKHGVYRDRSVTNVNLLEIINLINLMPNSELIFIEGDLNLIGVGSTLLSDLLRNFDNKTIIVNGTVTGLDLLSSKNLNIIAKGDIISAGIADIIPDLTGGAPFRGLLFSEGDITFHANLIVNGHVAGRNVSVGASLSEGILRNVLGGLTQIINGLLRIVGDDMHLKYDEDVFNLPYSIGFKENYVEVVEQRER